MEKITVTLTKYQLAWIVSSLEHDEMYGSKDEGIRGFRKRFLTVLHKAKNES